MLSSENKNLTRVRIVLPWSRNFSSVPIKMKAIKQIFNSKTYTFSTEKLSNVNSSVEPWCSGFELLLRHGCFLKAADIFHRNLYLIKILILFYTFLLKKSFGREVRTGLAVVRTFECVQDWLFSSEWCLSFGFKGTLPCTKVVLTHKNPISSKFDTQIYY